MACGTVAVTQFDYRFPVPHYQRFFVLGQQMRLQLRGDLVFNCYGRLSLTFYLFDFSFLFNLQPFKVGFFVFQFFYELFFLRPVLVQFFHQG
ncbi:MAG: hypothetical protein ACE5EN_02545 [Nitrospinota bacterium]